MAKQAQASRSSRETRTATAKAPAPKTATAELTADTPADAPAPAPAKPTVALVPDEPPKRRGRPPGSSKSAAKPAKKSRKGKAAARPDILFLVETEQESDQFETRAISNVAELLDLMDENRKVLATRQWREF